MGFITTLTANNDLIHQLPAIEDLGDQIYHAILKLSIDEPVYLSRAGIMAIESHHADYAMGVLVGGGAPAKLIKDVSVHYNDEDPELTFLKRLAEKRGYSLRKKTRRVGR